MYPSHKRSEPASASEKEPGPSHGRPVRWRRVPPDEPVTERPEGRPASGVEHLSDLELAIRCARAAGQELIARFGAPAAGLASKSSATDLVSDADRESERTIVGLLRAARPDDGILAEEGASASAASGRRWVVDPLDGTTNYVYGFPVWAVSIALEDDDGALVGVVFDPTRDELFAAERGAGATVNGERVHVRSDLPLERALVATGFSYDADERARQARVMARLLPRVRDIRRAGAAALDLAWVAAGRLDGYWERGLKPWDWAAGRLLVTEAGGHVREIPGSPSGLIAGTQALLDDLERLVTA